VGCAREATVKRRTGKHHLQDYESHSGNIQVWIDEPAILLLIGRAFVGWREALSAMPIVDYELVGKAALVVDAWRLAVAQPKSLITHSSDGHLRSMSTTDRKKPR
jgi:hypothetical protein